MSAVVAQKTYLRNGRLWWLRVGRAAGGNSVKLDSVSAALHASRHFRAAVAHP